MNIWWIVIVPLSLFWIYPMIGLRKINAPAWMFILFALFWCIIAVFAQPMYDWGTNIGRKLGHHRVVQLRERLKPKVLPPARAGLIIIAIISLIFAII
ncbi:hypothetical protein DRN98_09845 [Methanosarcinales archaeon]|nr:MAG: hypothetical protein DRN98_09845 [Methanosarcinales archaeon]